jgi:hypothetical protein
LYWRKADVRDPGAAEEIIPGALGKPVFER